MHNIIQSDALTVLFYHLVIDVASHEEVSFSMAEFSGTVSLSLEICVTLFSLQMYLKFLSFSCSESHFIICSAFSSLLSSCNNNSLWGL